MFIEQSLKEVNTTKSFPSESALGVREWFQKLVFYFDTMQFCFFLHLYILFW